MNLSLRRLGGLSLCLALAACPTPVAAPTASAGTDLKDINVGTVVRLDGSGSADPGHDLTYSWSFTGLPEGSHAALNDAHSVTPSFVADVPGVFHAQLIVANALLSSDPALVSVTVIACGSNTPTNGALTSTPASPGVGTIIQVAAAADDADNAVGCALGQALSFNWRLISQPASSLASLNNGGADKPSFTPDVAGSYVVRVVVTDSTGRSSSASDLSVTVSDCGSNAPSIDSITPSNERPGVGTLVQLNASVSDRDTTTACGSQAQTMSYLWTVSELPRGSHAALNSNTSANPTFVPDIDGAYKFRLVLTDSTGRASKPFDLPLIATACGSNQPVATPSFQPATPQIGTAVQLGASILDDDNGTSCNLAQTFTYAWSLRALPQGSSAQLNNATSVNPTFLADVAGDYVVEVVITDSSGVRGVPKQLSIHVVGCGAADPVIASLTGPAQPPNPGQQVTITSVVTDPDNACGPAQGKTYAWRFTARPKNSNAFVEDPTAANAVFVTDQAGTYQATLVVTDSTGRKSAARFLDVTTTTCGLASPSVGVATQTPAGGSAGDSPNPGVVVTLRAPVSDTDNAAPGCNLGQTANVTWVLVAGPSKVGTTLVSGAAASGLSTPVTFIPDAIGTYQFSAVATDSGGLSSAPSFLTFTTTRCGAAVPTVTVAQGSFSNAIPLSAIALSAAPADSDNGGTCAAGQTFSFTWRINSRPNDSRSAVFSDPTSAAPTFTPDVNGAYQLAVTVKDSTGLVSDPAFVSVQVSACGEVGPSVNGINSSAGTGVSMGTTVQLSPGAINSNNCLLPEEITSGLSAPFNLAGASLELAAKVGGALSVHTFALADFVNAGAATAAEAAASINADGALLFTARALANKLLLSSKDGLGAQLEIFAPGSGTDAAARFSFPSGQNHVNAAWSWRMDARPDGSRAVLDNPASATPTFTPDKVGPFQISVVATNALGVSSDRQFLTITAVDCSGSPLALSPINVDFVDPSGASADLHVGAHVTVSTVISDPNASACGATVPVTPFTYRWALVAAPLGSRAALTSTTETTPTFVPDVQGSYQLSVSVTDALGNASPTSFVNVATSRCGSNIPAVAIASLGGGNNIFSDALTTLNLIGGAATDADNLTGTTPGTCPARFQLGSFVYAWSIVAQPTTGHASLSSSSGTSVVFEAFSPGAYTVGVTATASNGLASPRAQITMTVGACGGHAPSINNVNTTVGGLPVSRPNVGTTVRATVSATDLDTSCGAGDSIAGYTWSVVSIPSGSAVTVPAPGSASAFADFPLDVAGTYQFSVYATDSTGRTSAPVAVTISTATCGPGFAALGAAPAAPVIGQAVALSSGAISDLCVTSPSYTYSWSIASKPGNSQAALGAIVRNAASTSAAFTADVVGRYVFQLIVTDNAGLSSSPALVTVDVASCGAARPVLSAVCTVGPCAAGTTLGSPVLQSLGASPKTTPDTGDLITLSVPAANLTDANATSCTGIQVTPNSWRWTLLSAPAGSRAALSASTDATPSLVPDKPGSYQLAVNVTDALGNTSATSFHTLVSSNCGANLPVPTITGASPAQANQSAAFGSTVADPDDVPATCPARFGNPAGSIALGWSIVSTSPGGHATLSSASGASSTFTATSAGTYVVQLAATDSTGLTGTTTRTVTLATSCGASAPVITSVTAPSSRPPVNSNITLTANSYDADTEASANGGVCGATPNAVDTTYLWSLVSAPAGSAAAGNSGYVATTPPLPPHSNFTFHVDFAGVYTFKVQAKDGSGLTSDAVTISVPTGSCGPTMGAITVTGTQTVGQTVTFNIPTAPAPTDACIANGTATLTTGWSLLSRPAASGATIGASSGQITLDVPGTYLAQLLVTDAGGNATAATQSISVGACSALPTIGSITAVSHEPDNSVALGGKTFAGDRVDLSTSITAGACGSATSSTYLYSWSLVSKPANSGAVLAAPGSATPSFTADVPDGTWQVALTVTDGLGNSSIASFKTLTAEKCGNQPTAAAITNGGTASVNTFASVSLASTASSPDNANHVTPALATFCPARFDLGAGFNFSWALVSGPVGGTFNLSSSNGTPVLFQPLSTSAGTPFVLSVFATGSNGVSGPVTTIAVTANLCGANPPLALDTTSPINATAFAARQSVSGVAQAAHFDADATQLRTGYPVQVAANVVDPDTRAGSDVPAGLCSGVPAQSLSVEWTLLSLPSGSRATLAGATSVSPTFTPDLQGSYVLQLISTDSTNLSTTQTFIVTTDVCGTRSPTVSIPAVAGSTVGMPVALAATVADLDNQGACLLGEALSYSWAFASVPPASAAALSGPTTQTPGFTPDLAGNYIVQLTVTDSAGHATTSAPRTISVAAPAALTLALAADQAVPVAPVNRHQTSAGSNGQFYQGLPVQLTPAVTGANCGVVTCSYAWTLLSVPPGSGAALNSASTSNPSFTPDKPGSYSVRLSVTGGGSSGTADFSFLDVGGCGGNSPVARIGLAVPTVVAASTALTAATFVNKLTQLDGSASSDADATSCGLGQTLTYSWSITGTPAGSASTLAGPTLQNPSFTPDKSGNYLFQLTVSDGAHSDIASATISSTGERSTIVDPASPLTAIAIDPTTNKPVAAVWDQSAGSAVLRVFRCASNCDGVGTANWVELPSVDTGLGNLTWTAGQEPHPVDIKVASNGKLVVLYHSVFGSSATGTPCGTILSTLLTSFSPNWQSVTIAGGSNCNPAGTGTNSETGRWLSLALDSNDAPKFGIYEDFAFIPTALPFYYTCTGANCGAAQPATAMTFASAAIDNVAATTNVFVGQNITVSVLTTGGTAKALYQRSTGLAGPFSLHYAEGPNEGPGMSFSASAAIDSGSANIGHFARLADDGTSTFIAYTDLGNDQLKFGSCSGACLAANAFNPTSIESPAVHPRSASLVVDGGTISLAYVDAVTGALRLATRPASLSSGFNFDTLAANSCTSAAVTSTGGAPRVLFTATSGPSTKLDFFAR